MNKTLHELQLKFIIKNKLDGYIVAAFNSADEAVKHLKIRNKEIEGDVYEIKESY